MKGLSFWPRLLATLAVDGGWKQADVGIRPYADMMVTRQRADTQVRPYKRHPVGADVLVGPCQPPGQRQRKEEKTISGTSLEVSSNLLHAGREYFNHPRFAVWR